MTNSTGLKISLLLSILFMLQSALAQNTYQSHMWEITGNGLSKPSYLFGTMHVSNKVAFRLGDPFYDAIESCDFVALELEPDIWMHEMFKGDYFSSMINKSFRYLGSRYSRGYSGNFLFETDHEKLITQFLKIDDGFTNFMLTRSMRGNEEYEEDSWLDMHIYQCAKKLKKKSFGLETFKSSMDNAERAAKEQMKDKDYYSKSSERMEMQTKMEAAYRRGDLDFVDSLSRLSYPGESYKYMLTDRNEDFVHTMDSLMKEGSLFAAMGCAHLPGKDGVIEMLRTMGYTVTPKSKGERDAKRKAEVEKKLIERPLRHFTSEERYISFDAPSEVYSMTVDGMGIVYLSLDMPNGGNYMLQRSEWWPALFKMNKTELANVVEDLLYEKIKGEIVSQKRSEWKGNPSFDIMSKNLKGEYTRMKIIITDNEMIRLSVQAPRDIVKKGYGKFFFDTFTLTESANTSPERKLFDNKLNINVPGVFHSYKGDVEMKMGGILPIIITNKNDLTIIAKGNLSNPDFIDEDEYEMAEFGRYFFDQTGYSDSISSLITRNGHRAIRATYTGIGDRKTETLLIGNGLDYYAIQVLTDNPSSAEEIFKSIKFEEHTWPAEYYPLTDSTLMFCAEVPWKPEDKEDDEQNSFLSMYGGMDNYGEESKKDIGYYKNKSGSVSDPEMHDIIQIDYTRNAKYKFAESYFPITGNNSKEYNYFRSNLYNQNPGSDYVVVDSSFKITNSGFEAEYIYNDTSCTRAHRIKFILDDLNEYTITYVNDSGKIHNPLIDHFLETFTPLKDSVTGGMNLFEDKFDLVYSGLQNPDTLEFNFAYDFQYTLNPENNTQYEKLKGLEKVISPVAGEEDKKYISSYWRYFQYMDKSDANIELLAKEYNLYQDSADYQEQILGNLINMETKKSRIRVKELLLKEPPIVDSPDFIYNLNDSVEKLVKILPSILGLTQYEEYKWPLYVELADALDSNAIKPSDYAFKLQEILREARIELKRTAAITEEKSTRSNTSYSEAIESYGDYPPPPVEYSEYDDYSYSSLQTYINLLEPHKKNPEVAGFLKQIEEHKKDAVAREYAYYLTGKKIKVPDAIAQKFIKEDDKLESVYMLQNFDRADMIPANWNILEEYVKSEIKNISYDYYTNNSDVDSLEIDSTFEDRIKSRSYTVHFIRFKKKDATEWTKGVAAYRNDNLSKTTLLPTQFFSGELSEDDSKGGYDLFGMAPKSTSKKELSETEKLENLWLDLKAQNRRGYSNYGSDYYDNY